MASLLAIVFGLVSSVTLVTGCSARAPTPATHPRGREPRSPRVRWVYHPVTPPEIRGANTVRGSRIAVDGAGGRWLLVADQAPVPALEAAPEPLLGVAESDGQFAFVGRSGHVYLSSGPLDGFASVRRPPSPMERAAFLREEIVGVTTAGGLLRSPDLGRNWSTLSSPGFAYDAQPLEDGRLLVMTLPEAWHVAPSVGAPFERLRGVSVAPRAVERDPNFELLVAGALGFFGFEGNRFVPRSEPVRAASRWPVLPHPSASRVTRGHAAFRGGKFVDVRLEGEAPARLTGRLDAQLTRASALGLPKCRSYLTRLAHDRTFVACEMGARSGSTPVVSLFVSDGDDRPFRAVEVGAGAKRVPLELRGRLERADLAVAPSGSWAFSGVCRHDERQDGCIEDALVSGGEGLLPASSSGVWFERIFDLEWQTVRQHPGGTPEEHLLVLGRGRAENTLELGIVERASGGNSGDARRITRTIELTHLAGHPRTEVTGARFLGALPEQIVVLASGGARETLFVVDQHFELISSNRVPTHVALDGAGPRILALEPGGRATLESLDAGATWERRLLPRPLACASDSPCDAALACDPSGCLVGDEFTRVGWGGDEGRFPTTLARDSVLSREGDVGRSFSCTEGGAGWEALDDLIAIPRADDAALDETLFAQVAASFETGSVTIVSGTGSRLSQKELLGKVAEPRSFALAVSQQIEGTAVLRYRVSETSASSQELGSVEVAWDNRIARISRVARLPGVFGAEQGDFEPTSGPVRMAHPGLLSVAGPGLYVRLHASGRGPLFFLDGTSVQRPVSVSWPSSLSPGASEEMLRVDGRDVPVLLSANRSTLFWADGSGGPAGAALLLPPEGQRAAVGTGVGIGYLGERVGYLTIQAGLDVPFHRATFSTMSPSGLDDEVVVPLLADVGPVFTMCSPFAKRSTPRVVAPAFPGKSHRLVWRQTGGPDVVLATERGVLFGTKAEPCVAALEASVISEPTRVPEQGALDYSALVEPTPGGGLSGFLFRTQSDAGRLGARVSVRPVNCSPD